MDQLLTSSRSGHIARLMLNDPARYNALSLQMIEDLIDTLTRIAGQDDIRVVVLAAQGKAFSAGHDLRQMVEGTQADDANDRIRHLFDRCATLMQLITALPQPVIAQVQGIATAAGCQLVASCDMAVAAETARFGVNGVSLGLFCSTPMVALTRAIPPKAAFEMLTTGDFINAARARELGLINRIAPPDDLEAATMQLAESVAAKLPAAIRLGKAAFHRQMNQPLDMAYQGAGQTMCDNVMLPDTIEGMRAFLEKRPPDWR